MNRVAESPNLLRSLPKELVAVTMATLLVATACRGNKVAAKPVTPVTTKTTPPLSMLPLGQRIDQATEKALKEFRDGVATKRVARVLIGTCVGWPTAGGKIAVTYSPGLGSYQNGKVDLVVDIFSRVDTSVVPPQIHFANGVDSYKDAAGTSNTFDQAITLVPTQIPKGMQTNSLERHLSPAPVQGPDGRWSYLDVESGLPVIKTAIVVGPLTPGRLADVCGQMSAVPAQN